MDKKKEKHVGKKTLVGKDFGDWFLQQVDLSNYYLYVS